MKRGRSMPATSKSPRGRVKAKIERKGRASNTEEVQTYASALSGQSSGISDQAWTTLCSPKQLTSQPGAGLSFVALTPELEFFRGTRDSERDNDFTRFAAQMWAEENEAMVDSLGEGTPDSIQVEWLCLKRFVFTRLQSLVVPLNELLTIQHQTKKSFGKLILKGWEIEDSLADFEQNFVQGSWLGKLLHQYLVRRLNCQISYTLLVFLSIDLRTRLVAKLKTACDWTLIQRAMGSESQAPRRRPPTGVQECTDFIRELGSMSNSSENICLWHEAWTSSQRQIEPNEGEFHLIYQGQSQLSGPSARLVVGPSGGVLSLLAMIDILLEVLSSYTERSNLAVITSHRPQDNSRQGIDLGTHRLLINLMCVGIENASLIAPDVPKSMIDEFARSGISGSKESINVGYVQLVAESPLIDDSEGTGPPHKLRKLAQNSVPPHECRGQWLQYDARLANGTTKAHISQVITALDDSVKWLRGLRALFVALCETSEP